MSVSNLDFIDLDMKAEKIINEAKKKAELIIREARKKANEILSMPYPIEEIEKEKESILKDTEEKVSSIIREAEEKAKLLRDKASAKYEKTLNYVVNIVAGLNEWAFTE